MGHTYSSFGALSIRQWLSEFLYIGPARPNLGIGVGSTEVGIAAPGGPQDPARFRNVWIPWVESKRRLKVRPCPKKHQCKLWSGMLKLLEINPGRACRLQGRGPKPDLLSVVELQVPKYQKEDPFQFQSSHLQPSILGKTLKTQMSLQDWRASGKLGHILGENTKRFLVSFTLASLVVTV